MGTCLKSAFRKKKPKCAFFFPKPVLFCLLFFLENHSTRPVLYKYYFKNLKAAILQRVCVLTFPELPRTPPAGAFATEPPKLTLSESDSSKSSIEDTVISSKPDVTSPRSPVAEGKRFVLQQEIQELSITGYSH